VIQPTVSAMAVASAYGHGPEALLSGVLSGKPAFSPVSRFSVASRRAGVAATLPGSPDLRHELVQIIGEACEQSGLSPAELARTPLYLALHGDPEVARSPEPSRFAGSFAGDVAAVCGLGAVRAYTSACVAGSTAVADAAAAIRLGDVRAVVVAGGYLVEQDQFALFDAGRALAVDGEVRPFSLGRKGIVIADGVAAIVLTADSPQPLAFIRGWGRAGDAYHVCQPRPDGSGMARAITSALGRAGLSASELSYVNAHGSGSLQSDTAEANALRLALGPAAQTVPLSSTKSLHGQALEASPLVELITTVLTMREGLLPVNAGFLDPDPECPLNLILDEPQPSAGSTALSLNSAFGGASTALILGLP
jgi:3-oxoacyl-[acyl-carrier-protein] synthase II